MFAVGFLHGTRIFKANSYIPVNTHIHIFLLIQKFVNRVFFVHSGNMPLHDFHDCVLKNIVSKTLGPILCPRQNERLKILFCFPENPHIIKLTNNVIIVMIPFFKNCMQFSCFPNRSHYWTTLAILITNIHCFPFYVILFTPDTFMVRYEIFLLHFLTQKHFFQTNKIDGNTNERYDSVYWKDRFFNICILWCHTARSHAHTGRLAENGRCVHVVWDNLKKSFITYPLIK